MLFGLYDWKFEMLAMQQHIRHLEEKFGVGPHTISVPRIEPAVGSATASRPPHAVSDADFKKIVAILRLAVPYTGIIMSTRENADTRRATFALGVSQISAGSRCNPGGYAELPATAMTPNNSSSATTVRWMKSCATWRRSATRRRFAPPAIGSAAPARISWIWPSPA